MDMKKTEQWLSNGICVYCKKHATCYRVCKAKETRNLREMQRAMINMIRNDKNLSRFNTTQNEVTNEDGK